MTDKASRLARGKDMLKEVYGPRVELPEGAEDLPFWSLMLENLFCDVWGRPGMSVRDRRLILIGVIASIGDMRLMDIQLNAALDKGEIELDALREIPLILHHYIGIARTVPTMEKVEEIIARRASA